MANLDWVNVLSIAASLDWVEILSIIASCSTILALLFAVYEYTRWKKNYRQQKSMDLALILLKNLKRLQLNLEILRAPKFINEKSLHKDIEKYILPELDKKISELIDVEIRPNLLIAQYILVKSKNFQSIFTEEILNKIIRPIQIAVFQYRLKKRRTGYDVENTEFFRIFYPAEITRNPAQIKESSLGDGREVVADDFQEKIEISFNKLYEELERNFLI